MAPRALERSQSLAEEIATTLENAIISGRLRPRAHLIELELASAHGVSRAPVREALRILERDGLVSKRSQGFEVADVTAGEAADIFEIMAHLEELLTRRATPHIGPPELRRMRKALNAMDAAVQRNDVAGYYVLNLEFHDVILDASPNRRLIDFLASLGKKTLRFRHLALSISGRLPVSLAEHRQIYSAIRRRDAEAAGRLARESGENAFAGLAVLLNQPGAIL